MGLSTGAQSPPNDLAAVIDSGGVGQIPSRTRDQAVQAVDSAIAVEERPIAVADDLPTDVDAVCRSRPQVLQQTAAIKERLRLIAACVRVESCGSSRPQASWAVASA
jgi:hypothetical protein